MTSDRDQTAQTPPEPRRHRPPQQRFSLGPQQFIKTGVSRVDLQDPYYFAVSLSWSRFFLLFLAAELAINTLFALLYTLQPAAIANQQTPGFVSAFFFSLETLATVGYGEMYPGTLYGHVVSTIEILTGVIFMAIMTGLLFVRFSKPKAKILYAAHPVVTRHNGLPTLMLRIANPRASMLHNVTTSLHVMARTVSSEGRRQVNNVELPLLRNRFPAFTIMWTVMHVIDGESPLAELLANADDVPQTRFFFTISARDPAIGQEVSDLHTFTGDAIRFGMRYVDAVQVKDENKVVADYTLLSAIEPDLYAEPHPAERGVEVDG